MMFDALTTKCGWGIVVSGPSFVHMYQNHLTTRKVSKGLFILLIYQIVGGTVLITLVFKLLPYLNDLTGVELYGIYYRTDIYNIYKTQTFSITIYYL